MKQQHLLCVVIKPLQNVVLSRNKAHRNFNSEDADFWLIIGEVEFIVKQKVNL